MMEMRDEEEDECVQERDGDAGALNAVRRVAVSGIDACWDSRCILDKTCSFFALGWCGGSSCRVSTYELKNFLRDIYEAALWGGTIEEEGSRCFIH